MEPEKIELIRHDFILGENSKTVVENFRKLFKNNEVDTTILTAEIQEVQSAERTFSTNDPARLGFPYFEQLSVRVVELNDAVSVIVSVGAVAEERVREIRSMHSFGRRNAFYNTWSRNLRDVRDYIPGDPAGPETSIMWVSPDKLPQAILDGNMDNNELKRIFSDGAAGRFIQDFKITPSQGLVLLSHENLLFMDRPDHLHGDMVVVDISHSSYAMATSNSRFLIAGSINSLAVLHSVHFWYKARGDELGKVDDRLSATLKEFSSVKDGADSTNIHNIFSDLFDIQDQWRSKRSKISSELSQLTRALDKFDPNCEESILTNPPDIEIFESYKRRLAHELNCMESDIQRIDDAIESIANYFNNNMMIIASRESVMLQDRIESQTGAINKVQLFLANQIEATNSLQRTLRWLTVAFAVLTTLFVVDALMSGGLSTFIDQIFNQGLKGISFQVYIGILVLFLITIGFKVWLSYQTYFR